MTGDQLSAMTDRAVRPFGLTAEVLAVDLAQRALTPVQPRPGVPVAVEGTVAGRAYQLGEILAGGQGDGRVLWLPMLDGTDRVGVLRIGLGPGVDDDDALRRRCWALSGLLGHILVSKVPYSDRLRWLRSGESLSASADLMWQLVPPRTFATNELVVTALLEPWDHVAGDAYDYSVNAGDAFFAVFDGAGHDLQAGHDTALAITAIRLAHRRGVTELAALAAHADDLLAAQHGSARFVTAVLATLDYRHRNAAVPAGRAPAAAAGAWWAAGQGTPAPVRGHRSACADCRRTAHRRARTARARRPAAALLRRHRRGPQRATASSSASTGWSSSPDGPNSSGLPAPETLRRLTAAVLAHQGGRLQDDATLVLVDWSVDARGRLFPLLA